MIIGNFNPLDLRTDKGALWENFLVSERRKQNLYKDTFAKMYFWRTKQQQEIDFVEERAGKVTAYEFKWLKKKTTFPQSFLDAYHAEGYLVDRANFRSFVKIENTA
jgi:predicted AAA+ superfamily ATPase